MTPGALAPLHPSELGARLPSALPRGSAAGGGDPGGDSSSAGCRPGREARELRRELKSLRRAESEHLMPGFLTLKSWCSALLSRKK